MPRVDRPTSMTDRTMAFLRTTLIGLAIGRRPASLAGAARMAALVASVVALLVLAGPASALQTHVFSTSFGTAGSGDGQVSSPQGVAVNASTHNVYVADSGNARIDEFSSAGAFVGAFGAGVGGPGVNICTTGCVAGTPGSGPGAFTTPTFVAVDNSGGVSQGDVYVADTTSNVVTKFNASGTLITSWGSSGQLDGSTATGGPFTAMAGITTDAAGNLFVYDPNNQNWFTFAQDGTPGSTVAFSRFTINAGIGVDSAGNFYKIVGAGNVEQYDASGNDRGAVDAGGSDTGFAVAPSAIDPFTTDIYVDTGGVIQHFAPSCIPASGPCTPTDSFGSGQLSSAAGLAADPTSATVYAADAGNQRIAVYGPVTVPDATTNTPTIVGAASATVTGHLDPAGGGNTTDCHFDYVDDATFQSTGFAGAQTAACAEGNAFSAPADVHAAITGLTPESTYHVRLSVTNANGTNTAAGLTFTTPSAVQIVTGEASNRSQTTATLNGTLNPDGLPVTSCQFEYGPDTSYGTSVPCTESLSAIGSGTSGTPVSADVSGLQAGSLYHYRLKASNALGTSIGQDQTFITQGPGFGIKNFSFKVLDQNGHPYTQAGGHPYEIETDIDFNLTTRQDGFIVPDQLVKDVNVSLPPGLVGDPTAVSQCSISVLQSSNDQDVAQPVHCPPSSQVGVLTLDFDQTFIGHIERLPVYNMAPQAGLPAQFGFAYASVVAVIDNSVRSGSDYGLDATLGNIQTLLPIHDSKLTLWGVPADPSHNVDRSCFTASGNFGCASSGIQRPLFTNPTSCSGPRTVTARTDSWQNAGHFVTKTDTLPAITGCDKLSFNPSISIQPDTTAADSPSGLHVDVHVPQGGLQAPDGVATSNLKQAVVTLPAGVAVNPASAAGLGACSPAQVALSSSAPASCPDSAKVGSVEVDTPLLPDPLKGGVYLAKQNDNPFGSLLAIYVTAEADGVVVKLAGHVKADPVTGQLTTTFDNNPPLPFSDFKLDFFGGVRAALATPDACGAFTSTSALAPWSGSAAVTPTDPFTIDSGCGGGFAPGFNAGVTNPSSGQGTNFTLQVARADGQQHIRSITTSLPAGLLANIASVPLCGDAEASAGSCDAGSQVGVTDAAAGAGSNPFHIAGRVYLTGPYKGAPYGLSIVVPALAGPFNLGTVVVRAAIFVDPHDSHVTVVSDDVPNVLDAVGADGQTNGFPLRVRSIVVDVNRPGFMVNPTSCEPAAVSGSVSSWEGSSAAVASRFQIGNCAALPFSPKFSASTTAKTSRANGASLDAKILIGVQGESNAHVVAVSLPKQLPSRLTTIQKACLQATFSANPAACPAASLVGTATAVTPLLPAQLSGPAYLVSHGGAAFPDLVIVLQGNGVTFDLVGAINISSKGITSTKFANAPDVPINSFELKLPQGPHSILTSNGSLCAKPLVMPTTITAYNAKQVVQQTKVKVTGCPKAKKAKAKKAKRHKTKRAGKRKQPRKK